MRNNVKIYLMYKFTNIVKITFNNILYTPINKNLLNIEYLISKYIRLYLVINIKLIVLFKDDNLFEFINIKIIYII